MCKVWYAYYFVYNICLDHIIISPVESKVQYHIFLVIRQSFFLPKQSQKFRSVFYDGSISLGLFRKGETCILAKSHRGDVHVVICSHSGEGKTLSCSKINMVSLRETFSQTHYF